jgi:carboxyl-terminal processing protease
MSHRSKFTVLIISGVIAGLYIIGGLPIVGGLLNSSAQQPVNDANSQLRIVESVLGHIQNDYVDEPNMEKVRLGALRGLAGGLDPYSSFLTAEQVKDFDSNGITGKAGIGAEMSQVAGYLYIISAGKNSPAERAGIRNGDVIEYIDNRATRDISLYDAKQLIHGEAGSAVSLRVLRSGERPQTIKVTRAMYKIQPAESRMEKGSTGVIKIFGSDTGQASEVRDIVASLTKQGAQRLVLDLRGLASGSLDEAASIANLFIKEGEIVRVIGREGRVTKTISADPAKTVFDGPIAAIIDPSTAGPGEVIASAILERKRGEVVGEKTFGAGIEQKLVPMKSGEGLLLTVAKWASASGKPFLGEDRATTGIAPSVEVKRPDSRDQVEIENLVDQPEGATPQGTPPPKPTDIKPADDIQLQKAFEILNPAAKAATVK